MKKFYFLAGALLAISSLKAQTTVDFEDLTLPKVDTFYNGSDYAGTFLSEGVTFNVNFNDEYDFWAGGFAYSNMRNDSTGDYTNLYSAFPASGANGSDNYAVNTDGDTLFFPSASDLVSVELTNTTFANLSMKNGDAFAKVFGSPNDAHGDPDGTDGKDFFYIKIYGHNANDSIIDSLNFHFADFTSSNSADHYILDTWKELDLTGLKNISYLTFKYFSSDVGTSGMNTPKFFALDNLVYKTSTLGIATEELATFNVYPNPANNFVNISGEQGVYAVYNINGAELLRFNNNGATKLDISTLNPGLYFIKSIDFPSITQKLIVK